eukprot:GHVL01042745.1.p1 GENE.GHVL01042745.1~~GHVL01042745.1.p1  ORF type:complete len:205 (+),score=57.42 GHVL01042745.1:362-976(+)
MKKDIPMPWQFLLQKVSITDLKKLSETADLIPKWTKKSNLTTRKSRPPPRGPSSPNGRSSPMGSILDIEKNTISPALRRVYCGVLDGRSCEGVIFVPSWAMRCLDMSVGDVAVLHFVKLPIGRHVVLRCKDMSIQKALDLKAVLESELSQYSALTQHSIIPIIYNNRRIHLSIEQIQSEENNENIHIEAINVQDCDISTDIKFG